MKSWDERHGVFWFHWWRGDTMNVVARTVNNAANNMTIQSALSYLSFVFRHDGFVGSVDRFSIDKAQQVEGRLDAFV